MDTQETFTNNGDLYDAPSNNEGDHSTKQEEFSDIQIMISLEPVENTTTFDSGRIQGVVQDNYVPFITLLPDDDYPDGMPDGEKYPEDIPDKILPWEYSQ